MKEKVNLFNRLKLKTAELYAKFLKLTPFKRVLIVVTIALVVVAPFVIFNQRSEDGLQYQTANVLKESLISTINASGTVTGGSNFPITTQGTGIIADVFVNEGDYVEKGAKVATITLDQNSQQREASAFSNYLSAKNSLDSEINQLNALQATLFVKNQTFVNGAGTNDPITDDPNYVIQRAEWLKAETDYNNQQNVIAQKRAAVSASWLSYLQVSSNVTAPSFGNISNLNITKGMPITSNSSTSIGEGAGSISIQSLGNINIEGASLTATVSLSEIDVINLKVGQKATLTLDAFPDKTFTGKVTAINTDGSVSSGVTTYPATITFDTAPKSIYPNMAVNAQIITNVKDNVLLVPLSAVQTRGENSVVRILDNEEEIQVNVEIGSSSDTQIEIISGLSEGDEIIIGTVAAGDTSVTGNNPFGGSGGGFRGLRPGGGFGGRGGSGGAGGAEGH